jgi:hypothetical protein
VDDRCVQSAALVTICAMTRGARTATVAGILLLTVAACKSGDARGTKPLPALSPSTTTTSPSPAVSPTTPAVSSDGDRKAAVVAFIKDYQAEVDRAGRTGDTSRLRLLSAGSCTCRDTVEFIENSYKAGRIRGMSSTVDRVDVQFLSAREAKLVVSMRVSPFDILDRAGSVKRHLKPVKRGLIGYTLRFGGAGWRVETEDVARWDR